MKTLRMMAIIAGWLLAGYALLSVMMGLGFHWNLFNWSPKLDFKVFVDGLVLVGILGGTWFLARATRDKVGRVTSLLVCLLLVAFAFTLLPAEPLTAGFLGRTAPSPLWYRGGCFVLLCLPGVIWLSTARRHSAHDSMACPKLIMEDQ
jgi:hypothetical protein